VKKAKEKGKQGLLDKTKTQIQKTLSKVKQEVFSEYGNICDILSEDELEERVQQMINIPDVAKLYTQLKESTARAMDGEPP